MHALHIVITVDAASNRSGGLCSGVEIFVVNHVSLDGGKEALGDGVVLAVSLPAHAGEHATFSSAFR